MPGQGLPYALEIILQQFQVNGSLTNWNIYEEKSGSVCVKIRYQFHGGDQSCMDSDLPVSYKRKNQKQMERDRKRARVFSDKGIAT